MPIVIAVFLIISMSTFDIGSEAFTGAWAGGIKDDLDRNHAFLRLNADRTGRFVFVTSGKATIDFEIEPSDVKEPAGYVEITDSSEKSGVKIVVSGWSSSEDRGIGLLTGVMYMYSVTDGHPSSLSDLTVYKR
jgi:hypothetical protein